MRVTSIPEYTYRADDGSEITRITSMRDFKRFIRVDGKQYQNVILGGQTLRVHEFAHKSRSQHRKHDAVRLGLPLAPHYDEKGVACYANTREIEQHETAYARKGMGMKYDRPRNKGTKLK